MNISRPTTATFSTKDVKNGMQSRRGKCFKQKDVFCQKRAKIRMAWSNKQRHIRKTRRVSLQAITYTEAQQRTWDNLHEYSNDRNTT